MTVAPCARGFRPNDPTAGDRATTERARISFTLKEGGDKGRPLWVRIEEVPPGPPVLTAGDAFLGLVFREDVPFEEAQDMVGRMNRMLSNLSYTKFIT
jgi:hypothetical protein